jgi:hypothetical protein
MGWSNRRMVGNGHVPLVNRPGVVAVVSSNRGVYAEFALSVALTRTPKGTHVRWQTAGGGGVAAARNRLCEEALKLDAGWIWSGCTRYMLVRRPLHAVSAAPSKSESRARAECQRSSETA